jgi:NADPH-dependent 2,4-dienoyl-CoA reductase/sulfur reductase-like enzyme
LPPEFLSHSSAHCDLGCFNGRDVTVVGGGASAIDLAALLHEVGAEVRLVARQASLRFVGFGSAKPRPLWQRVRYPMSGIGAGWRSRFFTDAPMLFRHLPQDVRLRTVRTYLGPAGGASMKDRLIGRVPLLLACAPKCAEIHRGRVLLHLVDGDGASRELSTDHVIAATGYKVDLERLTFLGEEIRAGLRSVEGAPVLSRHFQSSLPGLYFAGLASASCFGPVMRFMFGAGYTARQISRHLDRMPLRELDFTLTRASRRLT